VDVAVALGKMEKMALGKRRGAEVGENAHAEMGESAMTRAFLQLFFVENSQLCEKKDKNKNRKINAHTYSSTRKRRMGKKEWNREYSQPTTAEGDSRPSTAATVKGLGGSGVRGPDK